jgi:hypothetical protein
MFSYKIIVIFVIAFVAVEVRGNYRLRELINLRKKKKLINLIFKLKWVASLVMNAFQELVVLLIQIVNGKEPRLNVFVKKNIFKLIKLTAVLYFKSILINNG